MKIRVTKIGTSDMWVMLRNGSLREKGIVSEEEEERDEHIWYKHIKFVQDSCAGECKLSFR